ncbi:formylglycine-generating enzyme family protein [Arenibacter lacus]|uniref:formylglycine-generating enzyme family protein n=1 Tax=Arenibacter lacus TaxID=2608629 RepID=UPI00123E3EC7|nr:formylglycine-generating enzyme family protein [Arenibacter lacus]
MQYIKSIGVFLIMTLLIQCKENNQQNSKASDTEVEFANNPTEEASIDLLVEQPEGVKTPKGMVWIPGGEFTQGAVPHDEIAMHHEKPAHKVRLNGFFMDVTEVTNAEFAKFVEETGYVTLAERAIDWEEMKKQVPAGTPKPHDSILQPGALTFKKTETSVPNLYDFSQWWHWTIGANWRQPNGPGSSIVGKEQHPVVQVAYEDALAYCEWAGRRLPTEAEWERAARGKKEGNIYPWGDDHTVLSQMANTWEGEFPVTNTMADGFEERARVKSYPPNDFGLYDMAGNVWEWTSDWYNTNYYKEVAAKNMVLVNPTGAKTPYNQNMPNAREKVMKGGSFLCNASYCASYRVSSRMASSMDSALEHLGFRTVATVEMLAAEE